MIDVILKKPGQKAEIVAIENSLEAMQKAVDGYIETVTVLPHLTVVCNEEGLLLDRGRAGRRKRAGESFFKKLEKSC